MNRAIVASALALASVGISLPVRATLVAYDNFESYSTGALAGNNGGTGFTSAYTTNAASPANELISVVNKTLSYSSGAISLSGGNNAVSIGLLSATNAINRQISSQNGDAIYMSFLFSVKNPAGAIAETFMQFGLGAAANVEPKASVGVQGNLGGSGPENFFARAGGGTIPAGSTQFITGSDSIAADTTYLVVAKMWKSTPGGGNAFNRVTLYLNPNSLTEPATATLAVTTATSDVTAAFSYFALRTARRNETDDDETYYIDNLAIGTTFADVVSVPEPASIGMLVAGATLLATRKRRTAR